MQHFPSLIYYLNIIQSTFILQRWGIWLCLEKRWQMALGGDLFPYQQEISQVIIYKLPSSKVRMFSANQQREVWCKVIIKIDQSYWHFLNHPAPSSRMTPNTNLLRFLLVPAACHVRLRDTIESEALSLYVMVAHELIPFEEHSSVQKLLRLIISVALWRDHMASQRLY